MKFYTVKDFKTSSGHVLAMTLPERERTLHLLKVTLAQLEDVTVTGRVNELVPDLYKLLAQMEGKHK